jgi:hypothetical protein|tara:strand:+ start:45 stop:638 length:594 start_codon:yes stop_codon:yes gene_type:complete
MKFICQDDNFVYVNVNDLHNYENITHADGFFLEIFSNQNLNKFTDNNGDNTLFKNLKISNLDWLEIISFIKNGNPMYYYLNNDQDKKESIILNVEKLNIAFNKLGGLKKFDEFYKNFTETINENNLNIYNPQEPSKDYKELYDWGIVNINSFSNYNLGIAKYTSSDGWSSTKIFLKKNDVFCWFRKQKTLDIQFIDN